MHTANLEIVTSGFALLVAGVAKGVVGLGLPLVATPVMDIFYGIRTGIPISLFPTIVTDVLILVWAAQKDVLSHLGRVFRRLGPAIVGVVFGVKVLVNANGAILAMALGVVVGGFVVSHLMRLRWPGIRGGPAMDIGVGLLAGFMQGAVGASGPILSMYLPALGTSRREFIFIINGVVIGLDLVQVEMLSQTHLLNAHTVGGVAVGSHSDGFGRGRLLSLAPPPHTPCISLGAVGAFDTDGREPFGQGHRCAVANLAFQSDRN